MCSCLTHYFFFYICPSFVYIKRLKIVKDICYLSLLFVVNIRIQPCAETWKLGILEQYEKVLYPVYPLGPVLSLLLMLMGKRLFNALVQ